MVSFADVHYYYIHVDMVGGSKKVQNYDVVIYGWSQRINAFGWVLPGFILLDGF